MAKEILCAYSVDFDAVAGWLGSYGGQDSPCDISRGFFAGEVGVPRPHHVVHPRPLDRELPRPGAGGGRGGA